MTVESVAQYVLHRSASPTLAAFGVLSTVQLAPKAGSNGVSDLSRELSYSESKTSFDVTLAEGTEPFRGGLLP
jgi:hypothetical protein